MPAVEVSIDTVRAKDYARKMHRQTAGRLEYAVAGYAKVGATAPCAIFENLQRFLSVAAVAKGGVFRDPPQLGG